MQWHVNVSSPAGRLVDRYSYVSEQQAQQAMARMVAEDRHWRARLGGLSLERLAASALDHDDPSDDVDPTIASPEPPVYLYSVGPCDVSVDCVACSEADLI